MQRNDFLKNPNNNIVMLNVYRTLSPCQILITGILLLLTACTGGGGGNTFSNSPVPVRVTFAGSGTMGIFDPSVDAEPLPAKRMWMSYSTVNPGIFFASISQFGVGIRLAYSDDNGVTWTDAGVDVVSFSDAVVGPLPVTSPAPVIDANSSGTWMSETSSLIYDPHPSTPANERWKIIWHQYLRADNVSYFVDYGWIAMKTAATPVDLAAATPVKLFAGWGLKTEGQNTGSPAYSPIGGAQLIQLNLKDPELNTCVFGEPGMLATDSMIYLAMQCGLLGSQVVTYTVLFSCSSPCDMTNANSWNYIGRILDESDAADIGHDKYGAPELVDDGRGNIYLIVTPVEVVGENDRYNGCRTYRFTDIDTGTLERAGGVLFEFSRVDGIANTHHGACSAHTGIPDGILYSQFDSSNPPEIFRIFQSNIKLL